MTASPVPQPDHADTAPALPVPPPPLDLPATVSTFAAAYAARDHLITGFKALVLWSDHAIMGRRDQADEEKRAAVDAIRRAAKVFGYRLVKEGE